MHRLRGELLLQRSPHEQSEGEAWFAKGTLDEARAGSASKVTSLATLCTTSLARRQARAKVDVEAAEACDLLAPVYDWFTEGFDTADLKDAKELLNDLSRDR